MSTKSIILESVGVTDLQQIIFDALKNQIEALKLNSQENDLLTRGEAAKFLSINSSTLWSYTNQGRLTAHAIGSRRYYKKSELLQALTKVSVK